MVESGIESALILFEWDAAAEENRIGGALESGQGSLTSVPVAMADQR